jgi:hypothetical protein
MKNEIQRHSEAHFPEMGRQLTVQYGRAIGGLLEIGIFGAMMQKLRETIAVSARGHGGKFGDKDTGIKSWLEQYAPTISRPTAYRFMEIADGLRREFNLGKVDLQYLLTTEPKKLEPPLAKKREQIQEFIEGRSQRQLLFYFAKTDPEHQSYHATRKDGSPRAARRTKDEIDEEYAREQWDVWKKHFEELLSGRLYRHLDDKRLLELHHLAMDLYHGARDLKTQRGI